MLSSVSTHYVIYGLSCACHPERGVRYVGQTRQKPSRRLSQHLQKASGGQRRRPVHDWARKHGVENVRQEILEECESLDALNEAEMRWIEYLGTHVTLGGLNLSLGGGGAVGVPITDETRARMSGRCGALSHMYGHHHSPEAIAKMSAARSGLHCGEDHHQYGKHQTLSVRRKIAMNRKDRRLTPDDVRDIRMRVKRGDLQADIASDHEISRSMVYRIVRGLAWAWVDGGDDLRVTPVVRPVLYRPETKARRLASMPSQKGELCASSKLVASQVLEIRRRYASGENRTLLAQEFNVTLSGIKHITQRRSWSHLPNEQELGATLPAAA